MNNPSHLRSPYGSPGQSPWQSPSAEPQGSPQVPPQPRLGPQQPPLRFTQPPQPGPVRPRWQPPVPESGPKRNNVLGVIALVVASVGTVLACLPVVRPAGWLLLPLGFILGFLALFGTHRKLGAAFTALAVSLVGTGIATIVGLMTVDNAVTAEFKESFATSFAASSGLGSAPVTAPAGSRAPEPARGPGSRAEPLALGETFEFPEWEVTIDAVELDGTAAVMNSPYSSDPPEAGTRYAVITVSSTYLGDGSNYADDVMIDFVTDSGRVISAYDTFVMSPEPSHGSTELYTGGSHTGHEVLQIPEGEGGTLRVSDWDRTRTYFVSTS